MKLEIGVVYTKLEVIKRLKSLHDKGYRYVARDKESDFLSCFSHKPKKYMELTCWGYTERDLNNRNALILMAYPIRNEDMGEISWRNRSATDITELMGGD